MDYPWYTLLSESEELSQGDIIKNCPVPRLILDNTQDIKAKEKYEAHIFKMDGVIVTQACDIANGKAKNVILCSVTPLSKFKNKLSNSGTKPKDVKSCVDTIVRGQQYGLHILNEYDTEEYKEEFLVVSFQDSFSVPIELLKQVAKGNEYRLRLNPPYREHLSQAYARFFMRVGLPEDIDRSKL